MVNAIKVMTIYNTQLILAGKNGCLIMKHINHLARIFILCAIGFLLSACGSNYINPYALPEPSETILPETVTPEPDVQDRVVVDGNVLPLPEERKIATYSLPTEQPASSVVVNLTQRAQDQSREGNFDSAANSLERALRIEPRNAMLWNRLADVRYLQKAWKKAVQLAAKSNTLAGSNQVLRRENWYLMSNAYKALGDPVLEQKYRDKLRR